MTSAKFLKVALPLMLLPAAVALLLPDTSGSWYAKVLQPAALLVNCALALWVSRMYRDDMRRVFLFLVAFFLLYGLVNIAWLVEWTEERLMTNFFRALLGYQVFTYLMLLIACLFILRVIQARRLSIGGWAAVGAGLVVAIVVVVTFLIGDEATLGTFRNVFNANKELGILYLLIRVFDVAVMMMLIPVLWLYIQNARAKYQESSTFSIIVLGVIASLMLVYLYAAVKGQQILEVAFNEFQKGSLLDAIYILGYMIVAVGLFAHRKHQDWSFNSVEKLLA